jgi:hypothetical protein
VSHSREQIPFPPCSCESLRLGSTRSRACSGYAVHVCAAARPRASCLCHWGCRLLRCGAGVRWAKLDLAWEFGSPGRPARCERSTYFVRDVTT